MLVISIPLVLLAGVLIYLYLSLYEINYTPETFSKFWQRHESAGSMQAGDNKIRLELPEAVISTELALKAKEMALSEGLKVDTVIVDTGAQRVQANVTYHGIHLPVDFGYEMTTQKTGIAWDITDMIIGKGLISKDREETRRLLETYATGVFPVTVDFSQALDGEMLSIAGVESSEESLTVVMQIEAGSVRNLIQMVRQSLNPILLEGLKNSTDPDALAVYGLLSKAEALTQADVDDVINHALKKDDVIAQLLMAADSSTQSQIIDLYGIYLEGVDQKTLTANKMALLLPSLTNYRDALMTSLESVVFANEILYVQRGQPYRLSDHTPITAAQINQLTGMGIPEVVLKDLEFAYDRENRGFVLAYAIDSENIVLMNDLDAALISRNDYETRYGVTDTGTARKVDTLSDWDMLEQAAIEFFQSEQVFMRYMRMDDRYAFVIASPDFKVQNYWMLALEKDADGTYKLLAGNIDSLEAFNREYPDFNMALTTDEIHSITLYNLEETYLQTIIKDLTNKHKLSQGDGIAPVYYAYGNKYIALKLSDGREMVYQVDRLYLKTVYDKDIAVREWADIPDLILLEDKPVK